MYVYKYIKLKHIYIILLFIYHIIFTYDMHVDHIASKDGFGLHAIILFHKVYFAMVLQWQWVTIRANNMPCSLFKPLMAACTVFSWHVHCVLQAAVP